MLNPNTRTTTIIAIAITIKNIVPTHPNRDGLGVLTWSRGAATFSAYGFKNNSLSSDRSTRSNSCL